MIMIPLLQNLYSNYYYFIILIIINYYIRNFELLIYVEEESAITAQSMVQSIVQKDVEYYKLVIFGR